MTGQLLTTVAHEITPTITAFFQQSLDTGIFPTKFKLANITPLHKKGSRSNRENYRPISLTSILGKCLEHIIASNFMTHLEKQNILTPTQHGFRHSRSTVSQLLSTNFDVIESLDSKNQVDGILLDFTKAFDRVPFQRLLYKLNYYGLRNKYLAWAESFLCNRFQRVVIDGCTSDYTPVLSGVPQGTVLRRIRPHLLFVLHQRSAGESPISSSTLRGRCVLVPQNTRPIR